MDDLETPTIQKANEFDAVKTFVEALKALGPEAQERALRYASEALGLRSPSVSPATAIPTAAPQPVEPTPLAGKPPQDIRSFTNAKAPKTDQQFAAVVAYFYEFEAPDAQRKDAITAKDLADAARLADRKRPGNALFTLKNAKNSGYLDAAGPGLFRLNTVGENLVAMTLPGSGNTIKSVDPKKHRRALKKVSGSPSSSKRMSKKL